MVGSGRLICVVMDLSLSADTGGRAIKGHVAILKRNCALDEWAELAHIVEHRYDRDSAAVQGLKCLCQGLPRIAVNASQRFVEDEEVGMADECSRDEYALGLAAGKHLNMIAGTIGQPHALQCFHRLALGARPAIRPQAARPEKP